VEDGYFEMALKRLRDEASGLFSNTTIEVAQPRSG
jgi:hypothetical protein